MRTNSTSATSCESNKASPSAQYQLQGGTGEQRRQASETHPLKEPDIFQTNAPPCGQPQREPSSGSERLFHPKQEYEDTVGLKELFQNTDDDMDVDQEDEPDQAPGSPHSIIRLGTQGQASSGLAILPRKPIWAPIDQQQAETSRTRTISGATA